MKKLISFAVSLAIILSLTACSHNNKEDAVMKGDIQTENTVIIANSENTGIFRKSELPQPENIGFVSGICRIPESDGILILGNRGMCLTDSTFGVYKNISFDDENIGRTFCTCCSDRIFVVSEKSEYDEISEMFSNSYSISVYGTDGSRLSSADIDNTEFDVINNILYADENKLLVCDSENCFLLDTDGSIIGKIDTDENISDIVRLSDGRNAACIADKKDTVLKSIDTADLSLGDTVSVLPDSVRGYFISGSEDYLFYSASGNSLYGLNSDNTAYKIIDMTASGFMGFGNITPISDNDFLAVENGKIILLSERDISEISEIQELTLAAAGGINMIEEKIADFNAGSNKYRIKLLDYSENYEYSIEGLDSAVKALEMDIALNKTPDMLYLEPNEAEKMAARGIFADLYEFMETDRTYSEAAFLPNYLKACEMKGHLYTVSPTFGIKTCAVKKSIADKRNWTIDEFMQVYESMPDDMELFEFANHKSAVLSFITNNGMNYIDYEDSSCSFDSEEYIKLLEFADKFPSFDEYEWETRSCRENTALLSDMYIESFRDINVKKYVTFGEDIAFAGAPSDSGNGSVIILPNQFAVMGNSPNKEGCWEFIRTLFGNADTYYWGIPVTKSGFEKVKLDALEMPYFIGDDGVKYSTPEIAYDIYGTEIKVQPMTESDAKYYSDFVTSITKASSVRSETAVYNIISEETEKFFAGGYTAAECADMIQRRVSIYLSEQS